MRLNRLTRVGKTCMTWRASAARAADDTIIGKTRQEAAAFQPRLHVIDTPCVQDMLQEYSGSHGCNAPTWWRPLVGVHEHTGPQDTRVQPRAKPSQYPSITDPVLDKRPQVAPGQAVENSTDSRIASPVDVQRPTLLTQLVPRVLLTVSLPEALGKGMTIMRKDGLYDHHASRPPAGPCCPRSRGSLLAFSSRLPARSTPARPAAPRTDWRAAARAGPDGSRPGARRTASP